MQEIVSIILRCIIVFIASMMFGLDRQKSSKPIGFGTYVFVAVGSFALGVTAVRMPMGNQTQLLAAIVTGIGFLGAGALVRQSDKVFGFTNAASIWLFSIFGLVLGVNEYLIALIVYSSIWMCVMIDKYLEAKGIGSYHKNVRIITKTDMKEKDIKNIFLVFTKHFKLMSVTVDKEKGKIILAYKIEISRDNLNKLPSMFLEKDWCIGCEIE